MDALRTAVSAWGATQKLAWPPTVEQARALTAFSPSALAAFARIRAGKDPIEPDPATGPRRGLPLPAQRRAAGCGDCPGPRCLLHRRRRARLQRLDLHGPGHHLDPMSDIASAVAGAIGTMKGPLHGGAPSEVVDQLAKIGSVEHAEAVAARGARSRRAADGLRPPRLPRLRPAGRRAAQGRRGHGRQARLAPAGDPGRGRRPARSRRAPPGPRAARRTSSSTRRRSSRASASAPTCSRRRSRWRATPAGRPMSWSRRRTTG